MVTSPVDVSVALLVALAATLVLMMASARLPDAAAPPEAETPTVVVVGTLATEFAVIEVLPEFEAELNGVKILSELGYRAHSITPEGLQRTRRITATHWRDCFLSVEEEA
jgi:hypothetical protein